LFIVSCNAFSFKKGPITISKSMMRVGTSKKLQGYAARSSGNLLRNYIV
jgi:hypothetical protein